jgi:hypothetical protein
MARPKISTVRDMQLKLNLTATEYECVVRRANAVAMRPTHYARMVMLDRDVVPVPQSRTPSNLERLNFSSAGKQPEPNDAPSASDRRPGTE